MPRPNLHAVRDDLALKKGQSAKLVTYLALDDILGLNRPRWQWVHPLLARHLDTDPVYLTLLQNYLEYRRARGLDGARGIRPHAHGAQIYDTKTDLPLDLVALPASEDKTVRLAALLREAVYRKVRATGDLTTDAEKIIARACMVGSWEFISDTYFSQRTAQDKEPQAA